MFRTWYRTLQASFWLLLLFNAVSVLAHDFRSGTAAAAVLFGTLLLIAVHRTCVRENFIAHIERTLGAAALAAAESERGVSVPAQPTSALWRIAAGVLAGYLRSTAWRVVTIATWTTIAACVALNHIPAIPAPITLWSNVVTSVLVSTWIIASLIALYNLNTSFDGDTDFPRCESCNYNLLTSHAACVCSECGRIGHAVFVVESTDDRFTLRLETVTPSACSQDQKHNV